MNNEKDNIIEIIDIMTEDNISEETLNELSNNKGSDEDE